MANAMRKIDIKATDALKDDDDKHGGPENQGRDDRQISQLLNGNKLNEALVAALASPPLKTQIPSAATAARAATVSPLLPVAFPVAGRLAITSAATSVTTKPTPRAMTR